MTTEEKAKAYADKIFYKALKMKSDGYRKDIEKAYLAGAAEALRSQWKDASKELPEIRQRVILCYKEREFNRPIIGLFKRIPSPCDLGWEWGLGLRHEDVIGWMPLPPLPNTEEP